MSHDKGTLRRIHKRMAELFWEDFWSVGVVVLTGGGFVLIIGIVVLFAYLGRP